MTSWLAGTLPLLFATAFQATAPAPTQQVGVDPQSRGCFHHDEQHRDWILEGDTFRCGKRGRIRRSDAFLHRWPRSGIAAERDGGSGGRLGVVAGTGVEPVTCGL